MKKTNKQRTNAEWKALGMCPPSQATVSHSDVMTTVYDNKGKEIKDPTAMRFSKAKVWANIELQQGYIEEKFAQVEGKKYRDGCGTKQCATQKGLELHEQYELLLSLGHDITQQWG